MKNQAVFFVFLLNRTMLENQSQNEHLCQFSDKRDEKVVREKTYLLKLEFYNTDRKMKSIIGCIFISIIMHPDFMHFRQKVNFKSALEIFTSVSGHWRTGLTEQFLSVMFC